MLHATILLMIYNLTPPEPHIMLYMLLARCAHTLGPVFACAVYVVMIIFYFTSGAQLNAQIGPDSAAAKRIAKLIRQIAVCLSIGVISFAGCTSVIESERGPCSFFDELRVDSRDRLCMCPILWWCSRQI